ncbi:MAG TPA: hypothetical protein P5193_06950 [Microthrixaceae bacterium]|nr:hypothetical protein [Microthrixaceae bacterium]MCB9375859.1 hypothetical protein [Microthrixaceae bacterium]MCB9400993.1 hypothetical protein [Microthrixaceae bacterium]MCO5305277.1 hypothetical protein [Microthrixaceae bacterium]HMU79979.1 hypothetical protein [Microthrixaceae bacterium]
MTLGHVVVVVRPGDPGGVMLGDLLGAAGAEVLLTDSVALAAGTALSDPPSTIVLATPATTLVADLRGSLSARQRGVSVVVVVDDADAADSALADGADSVLIRPVEAERLVEAIDRLS